MTNPEASKSRCTNTANHKTNRALFILFKYATESALMTLENNGLHLYEILKNNCYPESTTLKEGYL